MKNQMGPQITTIDQGIPMEIFKSWPLGEKQKICENLALDVMRPPYLVKVTKLTDALFRDKDSL